MYALRRSVLIPTIFIVLVIVVGVLAVKSRGDNGAELKTVTQNVNCPPIARADAAATKPDLPIAVDVLANDTDPDAEPLVFQILKTDGGTSAIDDGGTPTDASDDRLLFTPAIPSAAAATIEYQALDPQGGFSSSTVVVSINADASLPDGVRSALATDPPAEGYTPARCLEGDDATTSDVTDTTDTTSLDTDTTNSGSTTTVRGNVEWPPRDHHDREEVQQVHDDDGQEDVDTLRRQQRDNLATDEPARTNNHDEEAVQHRHNASGAVPIRDVDREGFIACQNGQGTTTTSPP